MSVETIRDGFAFAASLAPAEVAILRRWLESCTASPGSLPEACEVVQQRLIRSVGRADVAGVGSVFVKVMAFPRAKDRLRYAFRRLPAVHEGRLLAHIVDRLPDVPCPEPLAVVGLRRHGLPWLSVLVTRGLAVVEGRPPDLEAMSGIAARLADAGVEHLDLHRGNFVALVESGLIFEDEFAEVASLARWNRQAAVLARIGRCLRESSEFVCRRSWSGVRMTRRSADADAFVRVTDAAAKALWIGDRAREILDGTPPVLGGAFFKWPWLPGRSSVYIPAARYGHTGIADRQLLLAGFDRFRGLRSSDRRPVRGCRS